MIFGETNDRIFIGRILALLDEFSGTCRYCGCHGESCSTATGDKCCWQDALRTLCTNPACLRAAARERRRRQPRRQYGKRGRAA